MAGYIDDGYTRKGYIKPLDGFHEGLRFEYRPATVVDRSRMLARVAACGGTKPEQIEKAVREASRCIVEKLVSWDAANREGEVLKINEQTLSNFEPHLHGQLFDIITGTQPSDENPVDEEAELKN